MYKRITLKVGSNVLTDAEGGPSAERIAQIVDQIAALKARGIDVLFVSSGAIAVGVKRLGLKEKPRNKAGKQACAAVGQANLMMLYQKIFGEYGVTAAQVLITKYTMIEDISRRNARATFAELLKMGVIPVVNENDTVSTDEIEFGDNDTLSAIVAALVGADLLILLSDIEGLYTDDPRTSKDARFIDVVEKIDDEILAMGKGAGSVVGTGGMCTKIEAARIATDSGADMIIATGSDMSIINRIISGEKVGTLFVAHKNENFHLIDYLSKSRKK